MYTGMRTQRNTSTHWVCSVITLPVGHHSVQVGRTSKVCLKPSLLLPLFFSSFPLPLLILLSSLLYLCFFFFLLLLLLLLRLLPTSPHVLLAWHVGPPTCSSGKIYEDRFALMSLQWRCIVSNEEKTWPKDLYYLLIPSAITWKSSECISYNFL